VLKNSHVLQLSEASCQAKLSQLKELLKNIHPCGIIYLLMKRHSATLKTHRITDWMHVQQQRNKRLRKMPAHIINV